MYYLTLSSFFLFIYLFIYQTSCNIVYTLAHIKLIFIIFTWSGFGWNTNNINEEKNKIVQYMVPYTYLVHIVQIPCILRANVKEMKLTCVHISHKIFLMVFVVVFIFLIFFSHTKPLVYTY